MQPEFGHHTELAVSRESIAIAKLEERQSRLFIEELSTAKLVARLESELQSKDRELVRLEAITNSVARLQSELQSKDRELVRLEFTVTRLESEMQHANLLHLVYASVVAAVGLAAIVVGRR